jgi:hypothetical protein
MALESLALLCSPILESSGNTLCITIPGQAPGSPAEKFCVTMPTLNYAGYDIAKQLIAQLNAGLMPYMPYIDAAAALVELFQCVVGIATVLTGNPLEIPDKMADSVACLQELRTRINQILRSLPPYSMIVMAFDATGVILAGIGGLRQEFEVLIDSQLATLLRGLRANRFGRPAFKIAVDCEFDKFSLQVKRFESEMEPLQSFMTIISFLASTLGGIATGSGGSMTTSGMSSAFNKADSSALSYRTLSTKAQWLHATEEWQALKSVLLAPFDTLLSAIRTLHDNLGQAAAATQPPQI